MKKIRVGGHKRENGLVKFTKVDDDIYEELKKHNWGVVAVRDTFYVLRKKKKSDGAGKGDIRLHRVILNAPDKMFVDHINGDGLDNRRCNLRLCTIKQNNWNKKKTNRNTSGYIGVSFCNLKNCKLKKPWKVQFSIGGKNKNLGRYATAEEASEKYNEYAQKYHGEFASRELNIKL